MSRSQLGLLIVVGSGIAILCLMMFGLWYIVWDAPRRLESMNLVQETTGTDNGAETSTFVNTANQASGISQSQTVNGLRIEALVVYEDAWPLIRAVNQFNDPPLAGRRMLMIKLRITNVEGVEDPLPAIEESDFELQGEQNEIYSTYGDNTSCGVVPSAISGVIPPQDWISGNVCFQIPDRPQSLTLLYEPYIGDETLLEFDLSKVERMQKYAVQ